MNGKMRITVIHVQMKWSGIENELSTSKSGLKRSVYRLGMKSYGDATVAQGSLAAKDTRKTCACKSEKKASESSVRNSCVQIWLEIIQVIKKPFFHGLARGCMASVTSFAVCITYNCFALGHSKQPVNNLEYKY